MHARAGTPLAMTAAARRPIHYCLGQVRQRDRGLKGPSRQMSAYFGPKTMTACILLFNGGPPWVLWPAHPRPTKRQGSDGRTTASTSTNRVTTSSIAQQLPVAFLVVVPGVSGAGAPYLRRHHRPGCRRRDAIPYGRSRWRSVTGSVYCTQQETCLAYPAGRTWQRMLLARPGFSCLRGQRERRRPR